MSEERKAVERLCAFAVGLAVGLWALRLLAPLVWGYFSPFILAIPLAAMIQPVVRFLQKKLRLKHTVAVMIPVLLFIAVVIVLLAWFLSYGVGQLVGLLSNMGPLVSDGASRVRALISRMLGGMETLSDSNVQWIQTTSNNAISWLTEQLTTAAGWLLSQVVNAAGGVPYGFIYVNFLFLAFYFIAKDYHRVAERLPGGKRQLHTQSRAANEITHSAISGLMGFLKVQTIYALEVMVVSAVFWQLLGYSYAAVAGLAAGFLEFIPLLGCAALYIPWALIALLLGDSMSALAAIGLYLGLLLIRRLTEPKLLSSSIGVPPLVSLISLFAGFKAGGLAGLIGGPVVATVLVDVWRGHYLDFVPRDIRTLYRYLSTRWDAPDKSSSAESAEPAEAAKSTESTEAKTAAKEEHAP